MIYMTLNQIRKFNPCKQGWETLLKSLNKTQADDEPVSLLHILESNGICDAIWCMRVNWFDYKPLYMQFVNNCVDRAKKYSAYDAAAYAYDADAYAYAAYADGAAYAADAATDADAAAYAAAAAAYAYAADAYAAERKKQYNDLKALLLNHEDKQ